MRAPLPPRTPLLGCLLATAAVLSTGCAQQLPPRPSPSDRFYFPSGLAFYLPDAGSTSGILYVASANYDRRFDQGNVVAVNLDRVQASPQAGLPDGLTGLPPPATPTGDLTAPVSFTTLGTQDGDAVGIQSFAAEMVRDPIGNGGRPRLWVATRAEGDLLEGISTDASGEDLQCIPPQASQNCVYSGMSLAIEQDPQGGAGKPAAPQPYGVGLSTEAGLTPGELWVTHLRAADSPPTSGLNPEFYVVHLDARAELPQVIVPDSFQPIGLGSGDSLYVGQRNVFISGRTYTTITTGPDALMRVVDRASLITTFPQLALEFDALEARGLAMRADESRIYLATLQPSTLMIIDVNAPTSDVPLLTVTKSIPVPGGPNAVRLIERGGGLGDVVAITCQDDGSVAFYDDDIGGLALIVEGVGLTPYDLAVDLRPEQNVARLFTSNFDDGRVAVIDAALGGRGRPVGARLVATIGLQQGCIIQTDNQNCVSSQ
jgi:hypothetical protein